jgi:8-oxo-dGTP diphosphatase
MIEIVGGVLIRKRELLLGRRAPAKRVCPNTWDVLGGHREAGESLEQTLARELQEEIGVTPVAFAKIATLPFDHEGEAVAFTLYRVDAWTGEPVLANDEHTELRWFGMEAAAGLRDLAADEYREVFRTL